MEEILKVNYENEKVTLSARELHEFLEVKTAYKDWFPRMCEYGFVESVDFNPLKNEQVQIEGNREVKREIIDHAITIEMGKEISMLQRNEKGKLARQYFIKLEKDWNSPEKIMARALLIAEVQLNNLKNENTYQKQIITEYSPKASYYDVVLQTTDVISVTQIAKDYGKSANWLNDLLHKFKIQFKQGKVWLLYQKYAEMGYTKTKTSTYSGNDGTQKSKIHTYWTQKGRLFIYDLLKQKNILPLIDV